MEAETPTAIVDIGLAATWDVLQAERQVLRVVPEGPTKQVEAADMLSVGFDANANGDDGLLLQGEVVEGDGGEGHAVNPRAVSGDAPAFQDAVLAVVDSPPPAYADENPRSRRRTVGGTPCSADFEAEAT